MLWIVITGNVVDGFIHYGPFRDADEVQEWTANHLRNIDWTAAFLYTEVQ